MNNRTEKLQSDGKYSMVETKGTSPYSTGEKNTKILKIFSLKVFCLFMGSFPFSAGFCLHFICKRRAACGLLNLTGPQNNDS
jgi:hypothetical protein